MIKYLLLLVSILIIGCNRSKKVDYTKKEKENIIVSKIHRGEKLLQIHCYTCHNSSASKENVIAPPMIAIKANYIKEETKKEEFIKEFVGFIKSPTKENAKLKKAVKRFGLMPKQNYKETDLNEIATYIYDYEIDEPIWFKEHWYKENKSVYLNKGNKIILKDKFKTKSEIGLEYALETKKVLGKNLMSTIQKKGVVEALQFCNEKAYVLTDSMSVKYKANIKRVSDKPRNIINTANKKELEIINLYKKEIKNRSDINPIVEEENGITQFYYPIVTNSMCLKCHGTPKKDINKNVLDKITKLYPLDMAKGYGVNEVRGIWSIQFDGKRKVNK